MWRRTSASEASRSVWLTVKLQPSRLHQAGQFLAAGGVEQAIVVAEHFGAAGGQLLAGLGIGELGAAGIGEGLLGRIGDLDQMGAHAVAGEHVEPGHGFVDRIEEIADEDDVAEAADAGQVGLGRQVAGMRSAARRGARRRCGR